jgi:hypothetical protein
MHRTTNIINFGIKSESDKNPKLFTKSESKQILNYVRTGSEVKQILIFLMDPYTIIKTEFDACADTEAGTEIYGQHFNEKKRLLPIQINFFLSSSFT